MNDPAFADYADGMEAPMPDWIDDDFIKVVVAVAKELPGGENIVIFPSTTRKKNDTYKKMREMAARTRKRRIR